MFSKRFPYPHVTFLSVVLAVLAGGPYAAQAAVTLLNGPDIQSGYSAEESEDNNNAFSYSVSIPAGTQLAVVGVTNRDHRKASGTLGGLAMTEVVDYDNGDDQRAQILVRINPPSGTQTIAFTFSNDTKAETSGVYCFSGIDTDDFAGLNPGFPLALGTYASSNPSVSFSAPAPPAGAVIVSIISTKYSMGSAAMNGGGTKTIGYRRWPEWEGFLGIGNEINGGAMGIVTNLTGAAITTGWTISGSGTIGAAVIRQANLAPTDITPNALTVNDAAANDSVLGTLLVTDADGETPYAWTLLDDAGGRFKLSAASTTVPTVNVLVANTALIDRGAAANHSIRVRVGDKATYNADYTEILTVQVTDGTKPDIVNLVAVPPYAKTGDSVTLTVTVTDNVALSGNPAMAVNGISLGPPSNISGNNFSYTYTVPAGIIEGPAAISVTASDTSANSQTTIFNTGLVLDNTLPSITGLVAIPPFTPADRSVTLRVTATDSSGLQGPPVLLVNGVDAGAPASVSGAEYTYAYAIPAGTPDGPAAVSVAATDNAGNIATELSSSVLIIDNTPPAIADIACADSPARASDTVLVGVTVSDANGLATSPKMMIGGLEAGVPVDVTGERYTYRFVIPQSLAEGFVSIVVNASDKAGNNASLPGNDVLFIDNSPPVVQGITAQPPLAAVAQSVAIQVTAEDVSPIPVPPAVTVNGVDAGAPTAIDGNTYAYTYIVGNNIIEGPAVIGVRAVDAAGNESVSSAGNLLTLDASGPQVTGIAATPSPAKAGDAVTITCTASDTYGPLAGHPAASVNGVPAGPPVNISGNVYQYTYTVAETAMNGWATVRIQAADTIGNTTLAASSSVLLIDTVPPVITNIQANPNVVKDGDLVKITFAATDVTTALRANPTVTANGRPAAFHSRAGASYEYRYTIDGNVDIDGYVPIVVTAQDQVNNTATLSAPNILLIDSAVPTIRAMSAYPLYAGDGAAVTIVFTVNDDNGLPEHPVVTVNNREARFSVNDGDSYEYTYIVSKSADADGPAVIRVTATDVMGNVGDSQSNGLLIIDTTAPAGSLLIANGALFTRTTDVALTLTASDGPLGTGADVVRFSDDALNWTAWEPFASTRAWQLPSGQGYRTIYAELRDRTGNVSEEPLSAQIALDPDPLTVTVDGGPDQHTVIGQDLTLEVTVSGAFGTVTYEWTRLENGGTGPMSGPLSQSPVFVLKDPAIGDSGIYICTVTDELEMTTSPEIHVTVSEEVPAANLLTQAIVAAFCALIGAAALRRIRFAAHRIAPLTLMLATALIAGAVSAQPMAPGLNPAAEYTIIHAARSNTPDVSDEALAALAKEKGSIEVLEEAPGLPPKRRVSRWGEPGVGMPGFTSHVREQADKLKAEAKTTLQKDGRESCSTDIDGRCDLVFRFPKAVGAQRFEAALYDKTGQRRMSELRTETIIDGEVRPLMIRVDHEKGAFIQIFEYSTTPDFPAKARAAAAKAVRYDTLSKQQIQEMLNAAKDDDPIDRMVQFIVPPQGMNNLGFDSGWVPGGGTGNPGGFIVQVRLNIGAGFNYDANVAGLFTLANGGILTAGAASGHWGFYFGAHFFLKAAFDIPIPGFEPFTVDIPYVPDFNMVASDRDDFNNYLLDETSTLHNESLRQQVVELDIIELLITRGIITLPDWLPLPGIGVRLDVAPVADGHLTCNSIDLSDGNHFTTEGQSITLAIPPEGYRATVVYNADAELNVGAKAYPSVFIGIGSLWEYEWPPEDDEENILNQLQWLPIELDSFPFSESELNFTGQPSTGDPTDWFTQHFNLGDNNVSYRRVLFTPNYSNNYYVACLDAASEYRTNPFEGTPVVLGDNDFVEITLQDGKEIPLYGQRYSSFFIGSNGYITFNQGDTESSVNLNNHFDLPRISGIFTDLKPNQGGQILWKQYTNRVVVTYDEVFISNIITVNNVSCQIEMFFDGRIVITWLDLDLYGGLIGLSRGGGTPANYTKSLFTKYPSCIGAIPDEGAIKVDFQPDQILGTMARWRLDDGEWHQSGEMEAAPVGVHTLSFNAIDGWAPPPARQLVFTKDYLMQTTEIWTRQKGTVQVYTSPAYASWSFVDGDGVTHAGTGSTFVYDIPTGLIEITWPPLATFEQPSPATQSAVLYPNAAVIFTGHYPPIIGQGRSQLRVTLDPKGARTGGAQWRFNGGAWMNSGDEIEVPDGDASISFKTVYGWDAPAEQLMFIDRDMEYDLPFEYVRQRGNIVINVDPEGAPWAVIDGDGIPRTGWGDTRLEDLPSGPVQVVWGFVNTYTEPQPNPFSAELFPGDTLTVVGSYIPVLGEGEGLLSVRIEPESARNAGAQWRITGGEWRDSAANLALPDGRHLVKFKPLAGWIAPLDTQYMVQRNQTAVYTATYQRQTGTVGVSVTAPKAAWTLVDADANIYQGAGNRTLTGIPSGLLTLTWQPAEGFRTPDPAVETRTLDPGAEVRFTGDYVSADMTVDFDAFPFSGLVPLTVQFRNKSVSPGAQTMQYRWYFGDGDTSTEAEPVHIYTKEGAYTVSLVATDFSKVKMETKKHFVTVQAGVPALQTTGLAALAAGVALLGAILACRKHRHARALLVLALILPAAAQAAEYWETHDSLTMDVGFPDWGFDTGWVGVDTAAVKAQVKLSGGIYGTVLGMDLTGQGWLTCPSGPNQGTLRFIGGPSTIEQNLGVSVSGQYRIMIPSLGINQVNNINILAPTGLFDSELFTAYNLGGTITLADRLDNFKIADIPVNIGSAVTGKLGIKLSVGDRIDVRFDRLDTSLGSFTENGEEKTVSTPGADLPVDNIRFAIHLAPDVTIYIIVDINLDIAGLTGISTTVNVPEIPVPLENLLEEEYFTEPARSISFGIAPTLQAYALNNGANGAINPLVNLNMTCYNAPAQILASEDPTFAGALWQPVAGVPQYQLSEGDGFKTVYVKIKNAHGESVTRSDAITLYSRIPTINPLGTNDTTPPLSGRVDDPEAGISLQVGPQTLPAVNGGAGRWSLPDDVLAPLPDGVYDVIVTETDAIGNQLQDATLDELIIDTVPPQVTIQPVVTNDSMTALQGTINDPSAEVWIAVWVYNVLANNNGDGTWTLPQGTILLLPGEYDILVTAIDPANNTDQDDTQNEVLIDVADPVVTINALVTGDTTPPLTGSISELDAIIDVEIAGQHYPAQNVGNGTWRIPDNYIAPLEEGAYDVRVTATDPAGNTGRDKTSNELRIDLSALTVAADTIITRDPTPPLSGTVNRETAEVAVTLNGITYNAVNRGDGTWIIADNAVPFLDDGVYDIQVRAIAPGFDEVLDADVNELTIDTVPPAITILLLDPLVNALDQLRFALSFNEPVAPTFGLPDVRLVGDITQILSIGITGDDPNHEVTLTLAGTGQQGSIGIRIPAGAVSDRAGNPCLEALSQRYTIAHWCGFTATPQNARAYLGKSHTFSVRPGCGAAASHYQWRHQPAGGKAERNVGGDSPDLVLNGLAPLDAGDYWCLVTYDGITYPTEPAHLTLTDAFIIAEPPPIFAYPPVGRRYELLLKTAGGYAPVVYEWTFNGAPIDDAHSIENGSRLRIGVIDESTVGVYTVTAIDDNGAILTASTTITAGPPLPAAGITVLGIFAGLCAAYGVARLSRRK